MEVQVHGPGISFGAHLAEKQRRGFVLPAAALGIAVLLPLAVLLGTAFMMGWKFQPIQTASMEPRYSAGSLAVIEPLDPADVRPGMTVVFDDPLDPGRLVAHRVVKRIPASPPAWLTKGDANAENDPAPVHAAAVQGRVRWAIPKLGRLVSVLDGWTAVALLVGLPLGALLVTEMAALRRRGMRSPRAS